jgi:Zn-dependent protease
LFQLPDRPETRNQGQNKMATATLETAADTALGETQEPHRPSKRGRFVLGCVSVLSACATFLVLRAHLDWESAVGFFWVFSAHELGHLAVARYHGVPSTWPIFIPNVGAFVLTLRPFKDPSEEAYIALGGPVAGLAATAILHVLGLWMDSLPLLELTVFCYAVHLVNMIPAGVLDGGRIANLVCKPLWVPGLFGLLWVACKFSSDGWFEILVALLALWPAAQKALSVLDQWRLKTAPDTCSPCQSHRRRVAGISIGVVAFALVGFWNARYQRDEVDWSHWQEAHKDTLSSCRLVPLDKQEDPAADEHPRPPDGL